MKNSPFEPIDVAIEVKKQSGTGMFRNQRLLLIKSGFISYYSSIPKYYVGNVRSLQLSGDLPKMTLSAADIQSIQRKAKYLHIKFVRSNLIDMEKLKKLMQGQDNKDKNTNNNAEMQEWVFKCENIDEAEMFIKQVLYYKNNPQNKPKIQNVIRGYKQGKKGFRPESYQMPVMAPLGSSAHRFSEQPEIMVKKFRTNTLCENPYSKEPSFLPSEQSKPKISDPIHEKVVEQQNQQQPPAKNAKSTTKSIQQKQSSPFNKKQAPQILQTNTYSKQTFPYFPFVKTRQTLKKQEEMDIKFSKYSNQDKSLIEKLKNNRIKNISQIQQPKKAKSQKVVTPKRSLTFDNKKQLIMEKPETPTNSASVNRSSSWSQLKKLKRAYSLIGSLRKQSNNSVGQQQEQQIHEPQPDLVEVEPPFTPQVSAIDESCFILDEKLPLESNQSTIMETQNKLEKEKEKEKEEEEDMILTKLIQPECQKASQPKIQQILPAKQKREQEIIKTPSIQKEEVNKCNIGPQTQPSSVSITNITQAIQNIQNTPPRFETSTKKEQISQAVPLVQNIVNLKVTLTESKITSTEKCETPEPAIVKTAQQPKPMSQLPIRSQIIATAQPHIEQSSNLQNENSNLSQKPKQLKDQFDQIRNNQEPYLKPKIEMKKEQKLQEEFLNQIKEESQKKLDPISKQTEAVNTTKISETTLNNSMMSEQEKEADEQIQIYPQVPIDHMKKQASKIAYQPFIPEIEEPIRVKKQEEVLISNHPQIILQDENEDQEQAEENESYQNRMLEIKDNINNETIQEIFTQKQEDDERKNRTQKQEERIISEIERNDEASKDRSWQKDLDVISFQNLELGQKKQMPMTPRFWQDQSNQFSLIQSLAKQKERKERSQAFQKLLQAGQRQKNQIKTLQNEQTQKQALIYSHYLLTPTSPLPSTSTINSTSTSTLKADQIHQTLLKITKNLQASTLQNIPLPIAMELLAIRRQNLYRLRALELMVSLVDGRYFGQGVDCQSIMFGRRVRLDGWCLYLCTDQLAYRGIFGLYTKLSAQCGLISSKSMKLRAPRVLGLKYKGKYGIFLQTPQLVNLTPPKSTTTMLQKILPKQTHKQLISQTKLGQDRQTNELIICINPDYIGNMLELDGENLRKGQGQGQGQGEEGIMEVGLGDLGNIVEYAWKDYVQCNQEPEKVTKFETLLLIFKSYYLSPKFSPKDQPQINQACSLQQLSNPKKSQIDSLYQTLTTNFPSFPTPKALQILSWKSLKLLAQSDLNQKQHLNIHEYLSILSTVGELYTREQKYREGLQICMYNLEVLMGRKYVEDLGTLEESKFGVILAVEGEEGVVKLCEFVFVNFGIRFQCQSKLKVVDDGRKCYENILLRMDQVVKLAKSRDNCRSEKSLQKLVQINAYYSLVLYELYFQHRSIELPLAPELQQLKQKSYNSASLLLKLTGTQPRRVQVSIQTIISYVDFLISHRKYQKALTIIQSQAFKLENRPNFYNSDHFTQLSCRKDICQTYLTDSQRNSHDTFINYLQFYMKRFLASHNEEQLTLRINQRDQLAMIEALITLICSEFAYNDEQIFYMIIGVLQKYGLRKQLRQAILSQGLNRLEPTIKRRVVTKLFS